MHSKVLTADNLQKKGWPHQEHCVLCNGPLETGLHLSLLCLLAQAVWSQVLSWENLMMQLPQQDPACIAKWWEDAASKIPKQERRRFNGVLILCATCGRRGIGGFFRRSSRRHRRLPPWPKRTLCKGIGFFSFAGWKNWPWEGCIYFGPRTGVIGPMGVMCT
jgi:hypothetical protein